MGTNYYFRKKGVDLPHLHAIADELSSECKSLVGKYNAKVREALTDMGIDGYEDYDAFSEQHTFYILNAEELCGDIHVGKTSAGWKPLMQASEHFDSMETLKLWYEKNKHEYIFINEYDEEKSFDGFLADIHKRKDDPNLKEGTQGKCATGFRWEYRKFS
ncbi:MAG: hypothetical protein FWC08_08380 [Defluviitaleaceae bacterium]|nr:hypothetical protein [Defluviitaleaceae bacterium]